MPRKSHSHERERVDQPDLHVMTNHPQPPRMGWEQVAQGRTWGLRGSLSTLGMEEREKGHLRRTGMDPSPTRKTCTSASLLWVLLGDGPSGVVTKEDPEEAPEMKFTIQQLWSLVFSPKELKTYVHTKAYTRVFRARLFKIAKIWKHPRCPSVRKWFFCGTVRIRQWDIIQHLKKKKKELSSHRKTWRELRSIL